MVQDRITHQRADNSRYTWDYDSGTQEDDDADTAQIGTLDQEKDKFFKIIRL